MALPALASSIYTHVPFCMQFDVWSDRKDALRKEPVLEEEAEENCLLCHRADSPGAAFRIT